MSTSRQSDTNPLPTQRVIDDLRSTLERAKLETAQANHRLSEVEAQSALLDEECDRLAAANRWLVEVNTRLRTSRRHVVQTLVALHASRRRPAPVPEPRALRDEVAQLHAKCTALLADRNRLARECADLYDELDYQADLVSRASAIVALSEWAQESDEFAPGSLDEF